MWLSRSFRLVRVLSISVLASSPTCVVTGAQAQVDNNLESRIDTFLPRPPDPVPPRTTQVIRIPGRVVMVQVPRTRSELDALLAAKIGGEKIQTLVAADRDQMLKEFGISKFKTEARRLPPTIKLETQQTPTQ